MSLLYSRALDQFAQDTWSDNDIGALLDVYYDSETGSGDNRFDALMTRHNSAIKSSGSEYLDSMIEKYHEDAEGTPTPEITPGTSIDYKQRIEGYIKDYDAGSDDTGKTLKDQLDNYISNAHDDKNPIHQAIKGQLATKEYDKASQGIVADYLDGLELKNPVLKESIKQFINSGTSKNSTVDDLLFRVVNNYAISEWPSYEKIKGLLVTYYASKTSSGDTRMDQLLERLKVTKKSTGSTYLDNMIQKYYNDVFKTGDKEQVQNVVNNATGGGGGGGTATDTRVSFTVSLGYNDELMRAELERKGLSDNSMIAKQEVNS